MTVAEAIKIVGKCGVALVEGALINPTTKQALIAMLTYQRAAILQSILANLEWVEQLDAGSRFLDRVFALIREETSIISNDITILQPFIETRVDCPAANVIADGIGTVSEYIENTAAKALQLITGKKESLGDLNNLAYEAQRKVTLRRATTAGIEQLENRLSFVDALIVLINNL